ncbi:hypothetical protein FNAPI_7136 [Fusarium napiforme]|uniref:NmrA-like domain-containing protein n=1 Tax=Fusarium napiforme TaxID=42672 RepID=A0A8H5JCN7_9HYPO|nr:hypothetical protein FNAPI_7136 [Fusarium napiforme]
MFDNYTRESYIFNAGSLAVHCFGDLPYALPPVGQWRFRVSRRLPKDYRYGTGKFTDGAKVCPQPPSSNTPDPSVVSEDCLQLNIWVPAGPPPKDGWPVCFYIHGGFLQVGTSNTEPEDLVSLLSESAFRAIMVLPSYRLNVFGFLASTELAAEASSGRKGNYKTSGNTLADFSPEVTQKIMDHYCGSSKNLSAWYKNLEDFFGRVYANIQVHYFQRGFHNALFAGGLEAGRDVFRYQFERRLDCVAEKVPTEWGVTHLTDIPIWLWGCGYQGGLSDQEKKWLKDWNEDFAAFVNGDEVIWGTKHPKDMRRWKSDGETDIWEDRLWEDGVGFWNLSQQPPKKMARNILIIGATGQQSKATIDALFRALENSAEHEDIEILALTRSITSQKAQALQAEYPSITLVQGDTQLPQPIFKQHPRITSIFSVTVPPNDEAQALPLIEAATSHPSVDHIVFSSVDRGGDEVSWSQPTDIPHFAAKHRIELRLRELCKENNKRWTILRPTGFMDSYNPGFFGQMMASLWAEGMRKDRKMQLISTHDIGMLAAKALLNP